MRGYADAQARQIFRDLVDLPATVKATPSQIRVTFHRRTQSPYLARLGPLCGDARLVLRSTHVG